MVLLLLWLGTPKLPAAGEYDLHFQQAQQAKLKGDFAAMESALKEALRFGPGDEYAWRSLAWAQGRQGKWHESLTNAYENIRRHGQCGWSVRQLFDSAMVAGDMDLARRTLLAGNTLPPAVLGDVDLAEDWRRYKAVAGTRKYRLTFQMNDKSTGTPLVYLMPAVKAPHQAFQVRVEDALSWKVLQEKYEWLLQVESKPDRPFRIIGLATLEASWVGGERLAKVPPGPCPEALRSYLGPFRNSPFNNGPELDPSQPDCLAVARPLRGRTSAETVQNILDWLQKNMIREPPYGPDTLSEILKHRHGLCHHHCNLMTSLCRAAGVPAVTAHGIALPEGKGEAKIGHGWLNVYLNGIGWVPVEPMNPASLRCFGGTGYLLMHTTGHTREQNHFNPRYRSLQNYTAQVERLE